MLMRDEKLAALDTSFENEGAVLTLRRGGRQVARAKLSTPVGRGIAEQFFAAYLGTALPGKPRIVHGGGHAFTDVAETWVSLINLASVRDLERVTGATVDPLRFAATSTSRDWPPGPRTTGSTERCASAMSGSPCARRSSAAPPPM